MHGYRMQDICQLNSKNELIIFNGILKIHLACLNLIFETVKCIHQGGEKSNGLLTF